MRARRREDAGSAYLNDALALLTGWIREGQELRRTLRLDDAQHAALTERIKVASDALQLRPDIRRLDGHTQIRVCAVEDASLSAGQVTLAARIEDAYRSITSS